MKNLFLIIILFIIISTFTSCSKLDVVGNYSITTFNKLIESKEMSTKNFDNYWEVVSPDGEVLGINKDFSNQDIDFYLKLDAADFLRSGLDAAKLPNEKYIFDRTDNTLILNFKIGSEKFGRSSNVLDTFKEIVKSKRDIISYHEQLDHYGIALGNGNMFEWAKDINKNDKDMVFVLNPEPFIKAGLDISKLNNWIFGKVQVKDSTGKKVEVEKLLKPYNL